MASVDAEVAKHKAALQQVTVQAEGICSQIERGQEQALCKHLQRLRDALDTPTAAVLMLALDTGAARFVIRHIAGNEAGDLVDSALERTAMLELRLGQDQFRCAFDDAAPTACDSSDARGKISAGQFKRIELHLPRESTSRQGMWYVVRDPQVVLDDPHHMSHILASCNMAVLTGTQSVEIQPAQKQNIQSLLQAFDAILPLIVKKPMTPVAPAAPASAPALPAADQGAAVVGETGGTPAGSGNGADATGAQPALDAVAGDEKPAPAEPTAGATDGAAADAAQNTAPSAASPDNAAPAESTASAATAVAPDAAPATASPTVNPEFVIPKDPWWLPPNLPAGPVALPMFSVAVSDTPDLGVLAAATSPLWDSLNLLRIRRKITSALEAAQIRHDEELKSLAQRQAPLVLRDKELDERAKVKDTKTETDAGKQIIEERLSELQYRIEDVNQLLTQRKGKFTAQIRSLVDQISTDDFEDHVGGKMNRKILMEEPVDRIVATISQALRGQMKQDIADVNREIDRLNRAFEERFRNFAGESWTFDFEKIEEREVWSHLKNEFSIYVKAEIEMPKFGVATLIGAARKTLMPFFMTLSLVGLGNVTRSLKNPWFMLPLVSLAIYAAYLENVFELNEKLRKEVDRVRDVLSNDATRIISDVQKEKLRRLNDFIADSKKGILKAYDEKLKSFAEERLGQVDRERAGLKDKMGALNGRTKDLQEFGKQFDKMLQTCRDMESSIRKLVADAGAPAPKAAAGGAAMPRSSIGAGIGAGASGRPSVGGAGGVGAARGGAVGVVSAARTAATAKPATPAPPKPPTPSVNPIKEKLAAKATEKKDDEKKVSASDRMAKLREQLKAKK